MPALIAWVASIVAGVAVNFGKAFTIEGMKFLATRALLYFLVWVALPIVIYNIACDLIFDFIQYAMSYVMGQDFDPVIVQLTGMGGWIGMQIGIDSLLAMILSAVAVRFTMSFIPFMR